MYWRYELMTSAAASVGRQAELNEGVIRVQAPELSKESTKVRLEDDMTAKDIVVRFYHAQLANSRRAQMQRNSRSVSCSCCYCCG